MASLMFHHCQKTLNQLFLSKYTLTIKLIHTHNLITHLNNCSTFQALQTLQGLMIKTHKIEDCYTITQFIKACSSLNQINYANLVVTHMNFPNVFVYNSLIRGFIDWEFPIEAFKLYLNMLRNKLYPTSYTLSPLIKGCGKIKSQTSMVALKWGLRELDSTQFCGNVLGLKIGESVHCHVWKMGFDTHVFVLTALIDFYGKLGKFVEACKVFDEMPERDSFAWSTIVSILARGGDMGSARELFVEMPERNATAWNSMIDGYARLGDVEAAELLFDQMSEKDLISWTTMISCYTQNKEYKKGLNVFNEMMENGICPDERTLATVISCCAHLGALNLGKKVHYYIMQEGILLDVYVGSALVDMYAKCGRLDRSVIVFLNLREKNLFCWNSIIEGLAVHGNGNAAIAMFYKMIEENVNPNGVTFISVLSACAHAGLVKEGREIFQSMIDDFQIHPEIKHYGCLVDLLCKAKLLEDALDLIRSMKIEPNSVIWGTLLSGSKLCRNIEIAEIAVSKLMELEPDNCGYYSLLLTLYADEARWKDVKRLRAMMRESGIEKTCPASSWIEVEKELHQFVASDKSHPFTSEICVLLDELDGQLRPAYD